MNMNGKRKIRFFGRMCVTAVLAAGLLGAGVWSCAKKAPDIAAGMARETFEAWVAKYAPEAYANPYKDVYVEFVERGPEGGAVPVLGYSWLTLDYTGKTLDGTVFVTRSDSVSRRVGKFSYMTHYADDFLEFSTSSTKLCDGLRQALQTMRVGDSVRVYIPMDKGYSYSMDMNDAYAGESVTYAMMPIMFEMRLRDLTMSPFVWERDSAERYARQHWGTDYRNDTVGMFMHIEKHNPEGDTITKDSSVYVFYEEYFMDGFLAATNVDTVAAKWHFTATSSGTGLNETAYDPMLLQGSAGANVSTDKVLYIAVQGMRKGEVAEVVTVSTWAQGDAGSTTVTPEVLPYQPMRYRIRVLEKWPEETEDEGDE